MFNYMNYCFSVLTSVNMIKERANETEVCENIRERMKTFESEKKCDLESVP